MNIDVLLQECVMNLDKVHKEAEDWHEQMNLLEIFNYFESRKELDNIAETIILFIEERIRCFQLEDFSRINIHLRKRLSNKLEMTQVALQSLVKQMREQNLLPNKLFNIRTNRRLSIAITELISMEIQEVNPYINFDVFDKLKSDDKIVEDRMENKTNDHASEQMEKQVKLFHSYFDMFMKLKFNASLSVYKLTLFLDLALNRLKSDLVLYTKELQPKDVKEQANSLKRLAQRFPSDKAYPNIVITNSLHQYKSIDKYNEDLALNYHLTIFTRQIENGLRINTKTFNPILQFELKSRLEALKEIFMDMYVDTKNIDRLMKEMAMNI